MKKIFIVLFVFILTLCFFNAAIAEEENPLINDIKQELDKIEEMIDKNELDNIDLHLNKLRKNVYKWAIELIDQNLYTKKVLEIINLSEMAIDKNNTEYIIKARNILEEIISNQAVDSLTKHS